MRKGKPQDRKRGVGAWSKVAVCSRGEKGGGYMRGNIVINPCIGQLVTCAAGVYMLG